MANLGYFQLKAGPGVWNLAIRKGRSDDVYQLDEIPGMKETAIIVDSFEGITLFPKVSKKPGMADADVLEEPKSTGFWDNIKDK